MSRQLAFGPASGRAVGFWRGRSARFALCALRSPISQLGWLAAYLNLCASGLAGSRRAKIKPLVRAHDNVIARSLAALSPALGFSSNQSLLESVSMRAQQRVCVCVCASQLEAAKPFASLPMATSCSEQQFLSHYLDFSLSV